MEKVVFIINHAEDDPEQCIHPLIMAVNAGSAGLHPVVLLQSRGVTLAKKELASRIKEPDFPSMESLLDTYISGGGRILVSAPSLQKRGLGAQDLMEGVAIVSPGAMIREIQEARHVLTY